MSTSWSHLFAGDAGATFSPYSGLHLVTICICASTIAVLVTIGRSLDRSHEAAWRRGLGVFGIVYWIAYDIWSNRHGIDLAAGLPLHICDLNGLVAPLALLTLDRWLRATLYF